MVFEELKTLLCLVGMGLLLAWPKTHKTIHPRHLTQHKQDNSSQACPIWLIKIFTDKPNVLTAVVAELDRKAEQETTLTKLQVNRKLNNNNSINNLRIRTPSKMRKDLLLHWDGLKREFKVKHLPKQGKIYTKLDKALGIRLLKILEASELAVQQLGQGTGRSFKLFILVSLLIIP